jgi:WD40 repeat protein
MGNSRLALSHKKEDAHDDAIWCATWVPNSNGLVTGSVDESVKIWTLLDEQVPEVVEDTHTYVGHTLGVVSVAIDVTGTYAASSALDSFIRIWNLQVTLVEILAVLQHHCPVLIEFRETVQVLSPMGILPAALVH